MIPLHDDNPTERPPILTVTFILACVLAYLWQLSLGADGVAALYGYGVVPAVLFGHAVLSPELAAVPAWATVVTSMFLHGGWMHLVGNLLYLWVFGNNVEDAMGHGRFAVFYLLCGVVAAMAQALPDPSSTIPMIGASGAISGVLGAYLLLYPRSRILILIPIGFYFHTARIPAAFVLGLWFVMQLVSSIITAGSDGGGVAWGAHIGGFIAGMVLMPLFRRRAARPSRARRRR